VRPWHGIRDAVVFAVMAWVVIWSLWVLL